MAKCHRFAQGALLRGVQRVTKMFSHTGTANMITSCACQLRKVLFSCKQALTHKPGLEPKTAVVRARDGGPGCMPAGPAPPYSTILQEWPPCVCHVYSETHLPLQGSRALTPGLKSSKCAGFLAKAAGRYAHDWFFTRNFQPGSQSITSLCRGASQLLCLPACTSVGPATGSEPRSGHCLGAGSGSYVKPFLCVCGISRQKGDKTSFRSSPVCVIGLGTVFTNEALLTEPGRAVKAARPDAPVSLCLPCWNSRGVILPMTLRASFTDEGSPCRHCVEHPTWISFSQPLQSPPFGAWRCDVT